MATYGKASARASTYHIPCSFITLRHRSHTAVAETIVDLVAEHKTHDRHGAGTRTANTFSLSLQHIYRCGYILRYSSNWGCLYSFSYVCNKQGRRCEEGTGSCISLVVRQLLWFWIWSLWNRYFYELLLNISTCPTIQALIQAKYTSNLLKRTTRLSPNKNLKNSIIDANERILRPL